MYLCICFTEMWWVVVVFFITTVSSISCGQTAVLILARGGSKGVKLKNLKEVGGISLLGRAINNAKSAAFGDITVSTDHPLIALEALKHGASAFHRKPITATDYAPSIWGAAEFLASRKDVDVLILLQATSPLIRTKSLQNAAQWIDHPVARDCVFSVTRSYKLRWKVVKGIPTAINFNITHRPRRQDWGGELLETGAFYVARRHLIEMGLFQNYNCTVVEISPEESLEVDTYHDIEVADVLLRSNL